MRALLLIDPDPGCKTCDGTGKDVFFGPFTGEPYLCACECRVRYEEVE